MLVNLIARGKVCANLGRQNLEIAMNNCLISLSIKSLVSRRTPPLPRMKTCCFYSNRRPQALILFTVFDQRTRFTLVFIITALLQNIKSGVAIYFITIPISFILCCQSEPL